MPHDNNRNQLAVGDMVTVLCKVKAIHNTEEYCNLDLETSLKMYPSENRSFFTLNARQVDKVQRSEDATVQR